MKKIGLLTLILFLFVPALFAQSGLIRGKVVLTNPNGSTATITGAKVDLYRIEPWAKMYTAYTGNSGEFAFIGLPITGTYGVVVTGRGLKPAALGNLKGGNEDVEINVINGDGSGTNAEQAKLMFALAFMKKAEANNAFIRGNALLKEKKYDQAIAEFDKGISADPGGSDVKFLQRSKALAYDGLAAQIYNAAIKLTNEAERRAQIELTKKHYSSAVSAAQTAMDLYDAEAQKLGNTADKDFVEQRLLTGMVLVRVTRPWVLLTRDTPAYVRMNNAFGKYKYLPGLNANDKASEWREHAKTLDSLGRTTEAVAECVMLLQEFPNDYETFYSLGMFLYKNGFEQQAESSKKSYYQQSADYAQKFLDAAPAAHKSREDARQLLELLKDENVTPKASAPKQPVKLAVADSDIVTASQVKDIKYSDPFYDDLQSLIERYGITGLTYGGEFRASEKLLVSSYEDISGKGLAVLKRMALARKLEPGEIFGLVCSLQSPVYVVDSDAIQHLNCLYGIKLTDPPGKVEELTRGEFATLFNQALGLATARLAGLKPRPKNALGMWRMTLTFKEGTQTYALFLERNGAVSGGKMFQIQGASFDIKNFRQVGKTVSFTAMFGKVPVAFRGTIDAALMNMKGSFTGTEKGKRMTATWTAAHDSDEELGADTTPEKAPGVEKPTPAPTPAATPTPVPEKRVEAYEIYYDRGNSHLNAKRYDDAIADYTQSIKLKPDQESAFMNRANAYFYKGLYNLALADHTTLIDRKGKKLYLNYSSRGEVYTKMELYDLAIADFNESIRLYEGGFYQAQSQAYAGRGIAYLLKNQYVQARADLQKALEIDPNNFRATEYLAKVPAEK